MFYGSSAKAPMMHRPRDTRPPGSLAALAAMLLGVGCGESAGEREPRSEQRIAVAAVELRERDLSRQLSTSATIEPRAPIRLASRTSGIVDAVRADVGDEVKERDVLALLNTSEQRAQLARAQAQADQSRAEHQRAADLRARELISVAELERARTALRVAESERDLWRTRVGFGRVTAPRDAVVAARHVQPGEAVNAQDVLFELIPMGELIVRLGVSELDVVHLEEGRAVPVQVDALPGEPVEGVVRRIHPSAEQGSRLVAVEVALPADAWSRGVRPGFLARVQIAVDERPAVLAVPSSAIGEEGDKRYVFVIDDGRLSRRVVELGVTRGDWTEVATGLRAGELVLATNPNELREGQAVRIVGWRG